ncbi:MAG: hypothetical protein U0361_15500 [Nitrospiraceae bacterium]
MAALNDADGMLLKGRRFWSAEQMAYVLDGETAAGLVRYLRWTRRMRAELVSGNCWASSLTRLRRLDMLKHPDAVAGNGRLLEHLLDPRSVDGLIDAMTFPPCATRCTLKKLA